MHGEAKEPPTFVTFCSFLCFLPRKKNYSNTLWKRQCAVYGFHLLIDPWKPGAILNWSWASTDWHKGHHKAHLHTWLFWRVRLQAPLYHMGEGHVRVSPIPIWCTIPLHNHVDNLHTTWKYLKDVGSLWDESSGVSRRGQNTKTFRLLNAGAKQPLPVTFRIIFSLFKTLQNTHYHHLKGPVQTLVSNSYFQCFGCCWTVGHWLYAVYNHLQTSKQKETIYLSSGNDKLEQWFHFLEWQSDWTHWKWCH